jgi:hypothetical protein
MIDSMQIKRNPAPDFFTLILHAGKEAVTRNLYYGED